jgi:hypothetical protein
MLTYLRQNITTPILPSDLYNINTSFKRKRLFGLPTTDALFEHLKRRGIHYEVKPDEDNRTRYLFIACPESIDLARSNQDVVLADCTYKTNKYDLPLLHLVGKCIFGYKLYFRTF